MRVALLIVMAVGVAACSNSAAPVDAVETKETVAADAPPDTAPVTPPGTVTYTEDREPCADASPWRNLYWGDLHAHASFSFDAKAYEVNATPAQAYAFARGEPIELASPDGTPRMVQLERPLDFAAMTEHGEYLGEILLCTQPGSPGYESQTCQQYRNPDENGAFQFGTPLSSEAPERFADVCGADGEACAEAARQRWQAVQDDAEQAYDRTAQCGFTTFVAYEYTNTRNISNLHRNVIFRNDEVPELPITYFEAPQPEALWKGLDAACVQASTGCDVMVLPHNSNLSNGNLFYVTPEDPRPAAEQRAAAKLRARMEPVAEIFQHKGDSECRNGLSGLGGEPDSLCGFEKLRPAKADDCGDAPGFGGMRLWGCVHRLDFLRNVLKKGLTEAERLGTNPYRLGFIASTDTHNAVPGYVGDADFQGHVGVADDTPEERMGKGNVTHDGLINNPGGLAAVWAVENSRDALFEALQRREVYGTSGPRIALRFFGGWAYDDGVCDDPAALPEAGYAGGVPMGGELSAGSNTAPRFVVYAQADPGTAQRPGTPLQRAQIIKGWVDSAGQPRERVYEVAGAVDNGAVVDPETCAESGPGADSLCAVWTDPDFDPQQRAFYYARVVENPSCRWHARKCLLLPPQQRPAACAGNAVPDTVQHRAWSSPIWYAP